MAEIQARDRLQPALLDRLLDNSPGVGVEPVEAKVLTRKQLRAAVLRDLAWLLNATQQVSDLDVDAKETALEGFSGTASLRDWKIASDARHSVLNFGLPPFAGEPLTSVGINAIEAAIREAVLRFEPRILPDSLQVRADLASIDGHPNLLQLEISGLLWGQPVPLELLLTAEIDCETGTHRLVDQRG